jgi:putative transposase
LQGICIGKQKINVSSVFAGQKVGITQVDDKIWIVQFMDYELGYFDTDSCRLEPIDNQLTSKLYTMCSV